MGSEHTDTTLRVNLVLSIAEIGVVADRTNADQYRRSSIIEIVSRDLYVSHARICLVLASVFVLDNVLINVELNIIITKQRILVRRPGFVVPYHKVIALEVEVW